MMLLASAICLLLRLPFSQIVAVAENSTDITPRLLLPDIAQLTFPYVPTLLLPPANSQRVNFVFGVGIPLSLQLEELVFGLTIKCYYLVAKAVHEPIGSTGGLNPANFPGLVNGRRRRREIEKHEGVLTVLEETDQRENSIQVSEDNKREKANKEENEEEHLTRWHIYAMMEGMAEA